MTEETISYEVGITKTSAPSPSKLNTDEHHIYYNEEKSFESFEELKEWIERYPDSGKEMKRGKREGRQVGWVFSFWGDVYKEKKKMYEQHWVEIEKVVRYVKEVDGKKKRIVEREHLDKSKYRELAKKSS